MKFFKIKKLNIKLNINLSWKQEMFPGDAFILEDNWLNEMDWVSSVVGRWQ